MNGRGAMAMTGADAGARARVAFDLDGTLTCRDTLLVFARAFAGRPAFAAGVAAAGRAALLSLGDRGRMKAAFLGPVIGGVAAGRLAAAAAAFWSDGPGRAILRPMALGALESYRAEGAELALVTACPEPIAAPFAKAHGLSVLATPLEVEDGVFTGRLAGPNCRGAEKVRRIEALWGRDTRLDVAYGDSRGDREMLARAGVGHFRAFTDRGSPRF